MSTAYIVFYIGAFSAIILGLIGIALTKRENTPIIDLLNPDELKSYWTQRLITEGITQCTLCKSEFRPGPGESERVCTICMPPRLIQPTPELAPRTYHPVGGRAYTPLSQWWPELYAKDNDNTDS